MSSDAYATSSSAPAHVDRLSWIERKNDDFPYYRGRPVEIGTLQWWIVMLAVAIGFIVLILLPVLRAGLTGFIPAILFVAIPLVALAIVAGSGWTAIFRRLRAIDFVWMLVFFILNWVVTLIVGYIALTLLNAAANPAGGTVAVAAGLNRVLFFLRTAIQLFGEELLTILPFLALLTWLVAHRGMGRRLAIVLAAIAAAVIFALVHLPTYQWNLPHTLVALVPVRIVLLLPYIMTKNIWVSTGTHVLNDWVIFGLPLLIGGEVAEGGGG